MLQEKLSVSYAKETKYQEDIDKYSKAISSLKDNLTRANLSTNSQNGQWVVDLEFNGAGTKKFAELTKALLGQQMAIFFNGELQSAPVIRDVITGGRAQISGGEKGFVYDE